MAKNYSEISKSFDDLAGRIIHVWTPHIASETTLKQLNYIYPALTPNDAIAMVYEISDRIKDMATSDPSCDSADEWEWMSDQADETDFVSFSSNPGEVARATFDFLKWCCISLPPRKVNIDWEKPEEQGNIPRRLMDRINSIRARLDQIDPRSKDLESKIQAIEAAHQAAERLPTDMEELQRSSRLLREHEKYSSDKVAVIADNFRQANETVTEINEHKKEADRLIARCEEAYRITTSTGLAYAFEDRSRSMAKTGWVWVAILAVSLIAAVAIGFLRLDGLKELLRSDHPPSLVILNLLTATVGIVGPIWLAWLATKNIGRSFKLAEDYAFKASVSKAYEGYRKEAMTLDESFAKRLFSSALTRLDEIPSRLMSNDDHNTPLGEFLSNPIIADFFSIYPQLKGKIIGLLASTKTAPLTLMTEIIQAVGVPKDAEKTKNNEKQDV